MSSIKDAAGRGPFGGDGTGIHSLSGSDLTDAMVEAVDDLHGTTDASIWARAFCALFMCSFNRRRDNSAVEDIEGLMIGWFANAIEAGRAAGTKAALTVNETIERWRKDMTLQGVVEASATRMAKIASKVSPDQDIIYRELLNLAAAAAEIGKRDGSSEEAQRQAVPGTNDAARGAERVITSAELLAKTSGSEGAISDKPTRFA